MKKFYLFLILICVQCYCLTKRSFKNMKFMQNNKFEGLIFIVLNAIMFLGYGKSILNEINEYRHNNMYDPQIVWLNSLAQEG